MKTRLCALTVLAFSLQALAADRLVPSQYPTIQAAIDAAADGDLVLVAQGTYAPFALGGKALTIRGNGAAGSVVIDASGFGRAVDASGIAAGEAILENIVIRNALLSSSSPVGGAGIEAANSRLALLGVRVENCSITWTGYGRFLTQGAGLRASNSTIRLEHCTFTGNSTTANNQGDSHSQGLAYGSAIAVRGGSLTARHCDITGNTATATTIGTSWHDVQARGAGIYADSCDLLIENCQFSGNACSATQLTSGVASCQAMGGALFVLPGSGTTTVVRFSHFTGNEIHSRSATSYDPQNYNATWGGAICIAGTGRIEDCTLTSNIAAGGLEQPAATLGGGICVGQGDVTISRCVISGNAGGVAASGGIRSGGGVAVAGGTVTLASTKICGNTFDQTSASAGGSIIDSGANCVQTLCGDCVPPCVGDLTANRVVDGADLGALLAFWGPVNPVLPQADINGDGQVDGADLGLLLSNWGACPN